MTDLFVDVPTFCAVVEAGGFSAAGRRLHLSRSAVGKAIARLERRLHVRLFHRTTRSQTLTEVGQAFYEHCQRASAELLAGKALLESGQTTVTGRLRVSLPVLFGRLCVAPILLRLADSQPELELDLEFSDRPVDLMADGYDLAVRMGRLGDSPGLTVRRVASERMSIFAGPAYLERHGRPSCLADLTQHQAVAYGWRGRVQAWLIPGQTSEPRTICPPTRLRFNDLGAIVDAAVRGFGLAWLPDWLVSDQVKSGTLLPILAETAYHVFPIHAVWLETPYLPRRIRVAIDAIAADLS
jgi:DNA-binding transcriptional LysR family regulator